MVIAASSWGRTHAVGPAAANLADDPPTAPRGKLNGRHFKNGAYAARQPQKNETKPIFRPGAERHPSDKSMPTVATRSSAPVR